MKLQQATLMYIVTQLTSKKEKEELQKTFNALDENGDGKLSRAELIQGYTKTFNDPEIAAKEVDRIMKAVDVDGSGFIDYSGTIHDLSIEFLLATVNKQKAVSQENLKKAFQLFDKVAYYNKG